MRRRTLLLRSLLGARLPTTRGSLLLPGLQRPLWIARDRYGIPHIDAETEDDAWFGLGFCQAQDRAFQLELRLRTARGTLSQRFGPQTLDIDRLSRRIGFFQSAREQLEVMDAGCRAQIEAFARGISAGLWAGSSRIAPEFALLRFQPTPWEPADVIAAAKLMSFLLIGNWDVELSRLKVLLDDGPQALRDLNPRYPEDHPISADAGVVAGPALDRLDEDLAAYLAFAGRSGGSNNWVLSGARTASDRPILANDPHLEATLPPHWYLARLKTPQWSVAGAALVGAPAFGAAHNGFAAWGITASLVDTVDLFVEEMGPDGRSVRQGDAVVPCEMRREVIEVKGRPPVTEDVLVTPRGPVIGPALRGGLGAISLRALWLDARPARGFLEAHKARSFEQFRELFRYWPLLSQNVVYADVAGTIAWLLAGEVPVRRKGRGTLPLSGADPDAGWLGETVPLKSMPFVVNPPSGFVATANNQPVLDVAGPYLGVDWLDGYRAARITEELSSRDDWDLQATLRLQLDEVSLPWREVRDTVLAATERDADARAALELLRGWDGDVSADSPAAAVFELFIGEMRRRIARSRAPRSWEWAVGRGFTDLLSITTFAAGRSSTVLRRLREQPEGWFIRGWPDEMGDALDEVIRRLREGFGSEPPGWAWGHIRPLTLQHPLGRIEALAPVFNRGPFPWGGDGNTVSQAGAASLRALGNAMTIASLRMAVEVGDWDNARFVLPGGQSGNPFSPNYDDLLPLWRRGEGVPIAWSDAAVAAATRERLLLRPLEP